MKRVLKKLLPALALTLMIAGTVGASVIGNSPKGLDETWYGVRDGGEEVLIPNPTTFNSDNDCEHSDPICVQIYKDNAPTQTLPGGPYNK